MKLIDSTKLYPKSSVQKCITCSGLTFELFAVCLHCQQDNRTNKYKGMSADKAKKSTKKYILPS